MSAFNFFYNRFLVPGFLVNSLPKAGTNLLAKTVSLFPGIHQKRTYTIGQRNIFQTISGLKSGKLRGRGHLGYSTYSILNQQKKSVEDQEELLIGVDLPQFVPINTIRNTLLKLSKGTFYTAHIPFSPQMQRLLNEIEIKTIIILRDPRDVVVSHAKYISGNSNNFLNRYYLSLSESDRIMVSITGINENNNGNPKLKDIATRFSSILDWQNFDLNYTTYFEKMVGPMGGGSKDSQINEIQNIANHLAINYNSQDINRIANSLFGGTSTFRKGMIGNWKTHFTEDHKRQFKMIANKLLLDFGFEKEDNW